MTYHFTDYEEMEALRKCVLEQEQTIIDQKNKISKLEKEIKQLEKTKNKN